MKKTITTIAALSALVVSVPAAAQGGYGGIDARIEHLQQRIQSGVQRGTISRHEAMQLRPRLRELTRMERQFSRDGLTRRERQILQEEIRELQDQIRYAERSGSRWDHRDGRHSGHYQDDGNWDHQGYDRRKWDRDGRD
jgi:uncharacterized protein HemX